LADAARPESESVRALELAAAKFAADPKGATAEAAALRRAFTRWISNDARFQELASDSPLLAELKPLSRDLASLGAAGIKLLDAIEKGQPAGTPIAAAELTRMKRPQAEVSLAAVRPIEVLMKVK